MEFDAIFTGVISNTIFSSLLAPVVHRLGSYFGYQALPQKFALSAEAIPETSNEPLVSIPLAIGYYYNLVNKLEEQFSGANGMPFSEQLRQSFDEYFARHQAVPESFTSIPKEFQEQLKAQKFTETTSLGTFDAHEVDLEIIDPRELSDQNLRKCSEYLQQETRKGSVYNYKAGRNYSFNFKLETDDQGQNRLRVIDYCRPVEVIPQYYEDQHNIRFRDEKWQYIQEREMQGFLGALSIMVRDQSSFFYDRTIYTPIG